MTLLIAAKLVKFDVVGPPVGKERAVVTLSKRGASAHTPKRTVLYESKVAWAATEAFRKPAFAGRHGVPFDVPVGVMIHIKKLIPKSWSKKRKAEALELGWASSYPDIDNVIKSILDAMNGIAYLDDKQVVQVFAQRTYSEHREFVEVVVYDMEFVGALPSFLGIETNA